MFTHAHVLLTLDYSGIDWMIDRDFIERANPDVIDKARMLLELIFVRNGSFIASEFAMLRE